VDELNAYLHGSKMQKRGGAQRRCKVREILGRKTIRGVGSKEGSCGRKKLLHSAVGTFPSSGGEVIGQGEAKGIRA